MSLTRRDTARQEILRKIGGFVEAITSATDTTVIANTLINRFGDDNALLNNPIFLPDQTATSAQRRIVTAWDDSTGEATVASLGETPAAAEDLEIYWPGDPFADEINRAINRTLQETHRTVWSQIPTIQNTFEYSLGAFSWVQTDSDVVGVFWRSSPNLISNEDFEMWGDGTTAALTRWVLSGDSSTVTRVAGIRRAYAARITRSGTDTQLQQTIGLLNGQLKGDLQTDGTYTVPAVLQVSVWVLSSTASMARIQITDGVGTTNSSFHTGSGLWEELTASHTVSTTATQLLCNLQCNDNNGNADFEQVLVVEDDNTMPDWLREDGSSRAPLRRADYRVVTSAPAPTILLEHQISRGQQLVIATQQPFYTLTADSDVTDMPLEAIIAGTLLRLAETHHPHQDRERWDRLLGLWGPRARRWQRRLAQVPVPQVQQGHVVVETR